MTKEDAKRSLGGARFALLYIFVPWLVYPTILIVAQSFPDLSRLTIRQYWGLSNVSHFRYAEEIIAFLFISTFLAGYGFLAVQKGMRLQFLCFGVTLSVIWYGLGTYIIGEIVVLSQPEQSHCLLGLQTCLPLIFRGMVLNLSIVLSILISDRLLYHIFGRAALGRAPARFQWFDVWFVVYPLIIPTIGYPTIILLFETLQKKSFRLDQYFENGQVVFYSSYEHVLLTVIFLLVYLAYFVAVFVRIEKLRFFFGSSILTLMLYSTAVYITPSFFESMNIRNNSCPSPNMSICLPLIEQGVLFSLCSMLSVVIIARLFMHRGLDTLYKRHHAK